MLPLVVLADLVAVVPLVLLEVEVAVPALREGLVVVVAVRELLVPLV